MSGENDYKKVFEKKMFFITKMVDAFGVYRVPLNWFNIAIELDENESLSKTGKTMHKPDTQFLQNSVIDMFSEDYDRLLKACGIVCEKKEDCYVFSLENLSTKAD